MLKTFYNWSYIGVLALGCVHLYLFKDLKSLYFIHVEFSVHRLFQGLIYWLLLHILSYNLPPQLIKYPIFLYSTPLTVVLDCTYKVFLQGTSVDPTCYYEVPSKFLWSIYKSLLVFGIYVQLCGPLFCVSLYLLCVRKR